jgi:hypothetical protein
MRFTDRVKLAESKGDSDEVPVWTPVRTLSSSAYRFALDPTPEQDAVLRSHCGGQRYAVNWGLALVTAVMDQRTAEAPYGIPPRS